MFQALKWLALAALSVAASLWLADLGGAMEVRVGDLLLAAPLPLVLLLLGLGFLAGHLLLSVIAALVSWPARRRAKQLSRDRAAGDAAVTGALLQLAVGAPELARLEVQRARRLLGPTPQILLLGAEAERMAGSEEGAAAHFTELATRPESRFLGLRGLLRQAMARQDWEAAKQLAAAADEAQPGAAWLRQERAELAIRTEDWRAALALAPPEAPRAALSLAAAAQEEDAIRAAELERQAFAADPGFAPAAIAHAARLAATGHARRGRAVLEESWQAAPHPEVAEAYIGQESEPLARVKAAETLARRNQGHAESHLLMGRVALAAGLTGRARIELLAAAAAPAADRRAHLALAELERLEQGDTQPGRDATARHLAAAEAAPAAPHWRCGHCGTDHHRWKPRCQACGTAVSIGWNGVAAG